MAIIESIKNFLGNCPLLGEGEINVNYLPPDTNSFTVDNIPANPIVKQYCDGETLRQYCFLFGGRRVYDGNADENTANSEFFENFEKWVILQNKTNNLPYLENSGQTPVALEVTKSGCIFDTARTTARFQIEMRLLYRQKN